MNHKEVEKILVLGVLGANLIRAMIRKIPERNKLAKSKNHEFLNKNKSWNLM